MGKNKRKSRATNPEDISSLVAPIQALQELISKYNDQGVIIGGVAASLLGAPRFTADIDAVILVSINDLQSLINKAAELGMEPRIQDPMAFAKKNRVLLMRHGSSGIDVDISLGTIPFEKEMIERSILFESGAIKLRLPSPEDLIIMKAIAHRQKDLTDIQAIANNNPNLDCDRIRYWVEQFGEVLELPNLWSDIEKYLSPG
jgi:predicted nucleotidyltransferase